MKRLRFLLPLLLIAASGLHAADWTPATTPNARQAAHQARAYGFFFHYGINTFLNQEWSDGSAAVSNYAPTSTPNPAQWVATAKAAGATFVIGISKHHEGFTLWDSADTTYGINTSGSGSSLDIIAELAEACEAQGMKLALYYSLWDRNRNNNTANTGLDAAYNATVISHLTELLTNYGEICELWLDGGWEKLPSRWNLSGIYDLVRTLQPNAVVMTNHTIGNPAVAGVPDAYRTSAQVAGDPIKYAPTDFRTWDIEPPRSGTPGTGGTSDPDPKTFTSGSDTYYLPFEHPITLHQSAQWFWHDSTSDTSFHTIPYLVGQYMRGTGQGNVFVLNVPPNKAGVLSAANIAKVEELATALGLSAGAPLIDRAESKSATASSEFSATYTAAKTLTGQVRGGPRWSAADADLSAPWIYVDLGTAVNVQRVAIKEWYDSSLNNTTRLGTFSIQTSTDASSWTTQTTATGTTAAADESASNSFPWQVKTFSATPARYVRLLFGTVSAPPTLNAIRIYGADASTAPGPAPGSFQRRF